MTRPLAKLLMQMQLALGAGLVVSPLLIPSLAALPAMWAVVLSGVLVAIAALAWLFGMARPGAGASLPAGLATLGTAMLPGVWATGVGWALLGTAAVALVASLWLYHGPVRISDHP